MGEAGLRSCLLHTCLPTYLPAYIPTILCVPTCERRPMCGGCALPQGNRQHAGQRSSGAPDLAGQAIKTRRPWGSCMRGRTAGGPVHVTRMYRQTVLQRTREGKEG